MTEETEKIINVIFVMRKAQKKKIRKSIDPGNGEGG
jgi:hypothetical protein